jgi:uncharacterized protein
MLVLLSPAKSFDFESPSQIQNSSVPDFNNEAARLIKKMGTFSTNKLKVLMRISHELASLNVDRYQRWTLSPNTLNAKQAVLAFNGEAYRGLNSKEMDLDDLEFAQMHLRILSGLYGVLRPFDLIQAHRLEMGTKLKYYSSENLYQFWGDKITKHLNNDLSENDYLINLASTEYFKSIKKAKIKGTIITPIFKDFSKGEYKVIMTYAKNARGAMANFIIKNRIIEPETIKTFNSNGYEFDVRSSDESNWVFARG